MEYIHFYVHHVSMYCATQRANRNGISVYIWTCGVVEYCASENVTSAERVTIYTCPSNQIAVFSKD